MDAAEKLGYDNIEAEYHKDYRNCVLARNTTLPEQLWGRLVPHLHQKDIEGIRPYGYGNEGLWHLSA
ncbi:hypothetical protein BC937DRAFT_95237 [Endogone sp. FLAS-F59071]|nr:hypothetical protein BC937DRAFT_95237 [Endogone sp. FLAS-F59071]|eukprot:RUS20434.1 hypothetical protein BC937DRAFT_95237 [Endogone sp. FLAS-F59071]